MNDEKKIYEERLKEYRDISRRIAELEIKRSSNLDEIKALEEERKIVSKEIVKVERVLAGTDTVFGNYGDEVKSLKAELDLLYKKREELENYDGVARAGEFIEEHDGISFVLGSCSVVLFPVAFAFSQINLAIAVVGCVGGLIIFTMPIWFEKFIYDAYRGGIYKSLGEKINEFLKKRKIKRVCKKISSCESRFFATTNRLNAAVQSNGELYSERKRLLEEKKIGENRACLAYDKIKALSEDNLGIDNDISELLERKKRLFIDLASREIDLMSMDELDEIIILDEVQMFDEKGNTKKFGSK